MTGEPLAARMAAPDMADAAQMEALRQSEARFRDLLETISDLIWEVNPDGVYTFVGPHVRDLLGYEPEELLGKTVLDLLLPEDKPRFEALFRAIRTGRQPVRFLKNRNVRKDGRIVYLETSAVPFFDAGGNLAGYRGVDRDITDREQAEQALRESERKFRSIVENSADSIVLVDERGNVAEWNRASEEITGLARSEVLGRPVWDVYTRLVPRGRAAFSSEEIREAIQFFLRTGRPTMGWTQEMAIERPSREARIVQNLAFPIRTRRGFMIGIITRDVSLRSKAEAERERLLREIDAQRRLFQTVVDNAPALIAVLRGPDLLIDFANPATLQFLPGMGAAIGRPLADLFPEQAAETLRIFERVLQSGEPYRTVDMRLQIRRGPEARLEEVYLTVAYVPLRNPEGQVDAVLALAVETTEQVRTRRRVDQLADETRRRAAELDAAIAAIPNGLAIYDAQARIIRLNAAAEAILGLSPAERQRPLAERAAKLRVETPEGKPLAYEDIPIVRALRGETVENLIGRTRRPDGTVLWASVSAAPIRATDGRILGAVVTLTDVTPLRELQEEREDLLRAVSHDLRNPLTAILGQAERLLRALDRVGMAGPERQAAEAIITGGRRMNSMIQDLVDAARIEAGQLKLRLQAVDLRAFIVGLLERQAETLEVGRIRLIAPADLPPVRADPDRLERILVNLLSNALKYSWPGTEVTITLSRRAGEVITAIRDRGPGIAPEDLPHIFERFYRVRKGRPRAEGLGLGLYITKGLVEAQRKRIWAESEPGVGSTFSFSLSIAEET